MTGKKTSSQEVYGHIRDMILNFDLYPGSPFSLLSYASCWRFGKNRLSFYDRHDVG